MAGKGVRQHLVKKPRAPRQKDNPGTRRLAVDKNYKPPPDDTKRVWLEVWQDNELVAEGDLSGGWAEAYRLLDNPEIEVLEVNHNNKDAKYFYTWLVKSDEEEVWIVHFNRKSTDLCCYNGHKGYKNYTENV